MRLLTYAAGAIPLHKSHHDVPERMFRFHETHDDADWKFGAFGSMRLTKCR